MASTLNASTTSGIVVTSDLSGELNLQADGTTVATVNSTGLSMAAGKTIPADSLTGLKTINGSSIIGSGDLEVGGGKVLQQVYNYTSTLASYNSPTNNVGTTITPVSTTITPTASDSKIMIQLMLTYECNHDNVLRLFRGTTEIGRNSNSTARWSGFAPIQYDPDNGSTPSTLSYHFVDAPSTTSATTYSVRIQSSHGAAATFYLNRSVVSAGSDTREIGISGMILTEIGA